MRLLVRALQELSLWPRYFSKLTVVGEERGGESSVRKCAFNLVSPSRTLPWTSLRLRSLLSALKDSRTSVCGCDGPASVHGWPWSVCIILETRRAYAWCFGTKRRQQWRPHLRHPLWSFHASFACATRGAGGEVRRARVWGVALLDKKGLNPCDELINHNIVSMLFPACIDCNREWVWGEWRGRGSLFFSAK